MVLSPLLNRKLRERILLTGWALFYTALVLGVLGPLLRKPGVLLSGSGDGIKNHFTFLYGIRFAGMGEWFRFRGFNHPFGDHRVMTDGQPFLAWLFRLLGLSGQSGPGISELLTLHNLILIGGLPVAMVALFAIFRGFRLPVSQAFVSAASVALLSPQIQRWGGHYALGHLAALPIALWLQLRRFPGWRSTGGATPGSGSGFGIALHSLAWGFVHPYFIPLFAFQSFVMEGANQLRRMRSPPVRKFFGAHGIWAGLAIFVQAFLPLVVFIGVMKLTDPFTDRGAAEAVFNSTFSGVFFAHWVDLSRMLDPGRPDLFAIPNFEGVSALGISAILTLFAAFGVLVTLGLRRRQLPSLTYAAVALLIAGTAALFFSFGFHLKGELGHLLRDIGPLRQFRSVGRFAWLFHIAFMVFAIVIFVRAARLASFKGRITRSAAWGAVWVFLFVQAAEATFWFPESVRVALSRSASLPSTYPGQGMFDPSGFQGIIPLPYFNIGSGGKDDLPVADTVLREVLLLSLATGIPVAANHSSRSSLGQAELSTDAIHRGIGVDLWILTLAGDRRDFLIWAQSDAGLSEPERRLLSRAVPIERYGEAGLYRISLASLPTLAD